MVNKHQHTYTAGQINRQRNTWIQICRDRYRDRQRQKGRGKVTQISNWQRKLQVEEEENRAKEELDEGIHWDEEERLNKPQFAKYCQVIHGTHQKAIRLLLLLLLRQLLLLLILLVSLLLLAFFFFIYLVLLFLFLLLYILLLLLILIISSDFSPSSFSYFFLLLVFLNLPLRRHCTPEAWMVAMPGSKGRGMQATKTKFSKNWSTCTSITISFIYIYISLY